MDKSEASKFLLSLHQRSSELMPSKFRQWLYFELRKLIYFDSGAWVNFDEEESLVGASTFNARPDLLGDFGNYQDCDENVIYQGAIDARLGTVVSSEDVLPVDDTLGTEIHKNYYEKHGIIHGIGFGFKEAMGKYRGTFFIQRAETGNVFSKSELSFLDSVLPHVIAACKNNFLFYLLSRKSETHLEGFATCTREGTVLYQDSQFRSLIELEWKQYTGLRLPPLDLQSPYDFEQKIVFQSNLLLIESTPLLDVLFLTIKRNIPLDKLTPRERDVFDLLLEGYSDGQIQDFLNISRSTCDDHKSNLFAKLKVRHRRELAALFTLRPL